jgi:hypothetical protein
MECMVQTPSRALNELKDLNTGTVPPYFEYKDKGVALIRTDWAAANEVCMYRVSFP